MDKAKGSQEGGGISIHTHFQHKRQEKTSDLLSLGTVEVILVKDKGVGKDVSEQATEGCFTT